MSNHAIEFNSVWKKFKRGEKFDSLRDLIPAIAKMILSPSKADLEEKEFWAVRDVSFQIGHGDALGIIGPNGSGKSTSLKLLSGMLKPDKGNLQVTGRLSTLIELGAGFHPDLTGRENIYLNGTILGMKRAEIDKKFDSIVDFCELQDFLDTPVKRYSSGMYARLGFAVAAHLEPEVLIVDEVLSVGDYHFQEKCFSKMREFTSNGTTLVFVSHNLAAISSLCTTALLLNRGEPVFQGDVRTAISKYYAFYEESRETKYLSIEDIQLTDAEGRPREVFEPGERAVFKVVVRALQPVNRAHAGLLIHTKDGQPLFDTATSRHTDDRLTLGPQEAATIEFGVDLNLQNDVFRIGFTVTSEFDEFYLYCNMNLKQAVMTGDRKSNGLVHLNHSARVLFGELPSSRPGVVVSVGE